QVMVVLVTSSKMFPGKNNFIKALVKAHPEITTIVMNINNRKTSVVLGREEITLYGKGYIEDVLCGKKFQISAKSFYQINPVQTEILYNKAIEMARLKGNETVMDRSEEHTSELQSRFDLVCRLLLEKKKKKK